MKTVFENLRKAANVPPPGQGAPLTTPVATPPLSSDGSVRCGLAGTRTLPLPRILLLLLLLLLRLKTRKWWPCAGQGRGRIGPLLGAGRRKAETT